MQLVKLFLKHDRRGAISEMVGPKGMQIKVYKLELKPGGIFHYSLEAPNGSTMWGRFVYRDIEAFERIVFVTSFSDEKGGYYESSFC
jgi:uncharacterized protein YndB with AHSA1/START domain